MVTLSTFNHLVTNDWLDLGLEASNLYQKNDPLLENLIFSKSNFIFQRNSRKIWRLKQKIDYLDHVQ